MGIIPNLMRMKRISSIVSVRSVLLIDFKEI